MATHPIDDLAAYALGALDRADRDAVARHLDGCATCRAELAIHERAVWALAESAARPTPPGLRERLIPHAATPRAGSWGPIGALLRPRVPLAVPLALALALVVAVGALVGARGDADSYARALAGVADGRVIALSSSGERSDVRGALVIPRGGAAYLVLEVPTPPAGKTWEAWIIRGDRPLPAGLTGERGGLVTLVLSGVLQPGDAVALTLERQGGVDAPTSAPVLLART